MRGRRGRILKSSFFQGSSEFRSIIHLADVFPFLLLYCVVELEKALQHCRLTGSRKMHDIFFLCFSGFPPEVLLSPAHLGGPRRSNALQVQKCNLLVAKAHKRQHKLSKTKGKQVKHQKHIQKKHKKLIKHNRSDLGETITRWDSSGKQLIANIYVHQRTHVSLNYHTSFKYVSGTMISPYWCPSYIILIMLVQDQH